MIRSTSPRRSTSSVRKLGRRATFKDCLTRGRGPFILVLNDVQNGKAETGQGRSNPPACPGDSNQAVQTARFRTYDDARYRGGCRALARCRIPATFNRRMHSSWPATSGCRTSTRGSLRQLVQRTPISEPSSPRCSAPSWTSWAGIESCWLPLSEIWETFLTRYVCSAGRPRPSASGASPSSSPFSTSLRSPMTCVASWVERFGLLISVCFCSSSTIGSPKQARTHKVVDMLRGLVAIGIPLLTHPLAAPIRSRLLDFLAERRIRHGEERRHDDPRCHCFAVCGGVGQALGGRRRSFAEPRHCLHDRHSTWLDSEVVVRGIAGWVVARAVNLISATDPSKHYSN